MTDDTVNVVIGGKAGQGLVTVGEVLTKALVRAGYSALVTQSYESRIRGGHNTYAVRVSPAHLMAPQESIDLLVGLDAETVRLHQKDLLPRGIVVVDEALGLADSGLIAVPFKELAAGRYENSVALGVIAALLGLDEGLVAGTLDHSLAKKDGAVREANSESLGRGYQWVARKAAFFPKLPAPSDRRRRLMLNGNQALALGALSAGVRFCGFYPMTPSTSVWLTLAAIARRMGVIVEQAEDEIAAINMALGASFCGAPAMVATSGGGFALMVEGVSLAAMTETPVVIVVAQRPGPATGLPTRTEQADLEFVLHAGHGEFPRAIFAPGTVEECFHLMRQAFAVAHGYQGPVFVLTDQFLADSYRDMMPIDLDILPPVITRPDSTIHGDSYVRYAITESGVSPRLLPGVCGDGSAAGACGHLVVADSDEHTEDGHITEDLTVRTRMVQKRLRKLAGIREKVVPPEVTGDESPDLLLVCWGSTKGSAVEAASLLRGLGKRTGVLHFSQVWPLVPRHFLAKLQEAGTVISVEGNATGQLARLIRRETGFLIGKQVLRYDGLPFTPEYILGKLHAQGV